MPVLGSIFSKSLSPPSFSLKVKPALISPVSVALASYSWVNFSSTAAISEEVIVGATSSKSLTAKVTACGVLLPAASVATTLKL